jgi:hypothetical protein
MSWKCTSKQIRPAGVNFRDSNRMPGETSLKEFPFEE